MRKWERNTFESTIFLIITPNLSVGRQVNTPSKPYKQNENQKMQVTGTSALCLSASLSDTSRLLYVLSAAKFYNNNSNNNNKLN